MMEPDTDLSFSAFSFDSTVEGPEPTKKEPTNIIDDGPESLHEMREEFAQKWQKLGKKWKKRFLIGKCLPQGVKPPTAAAQQLANQPWVFGAKSGCGCLPCSEAKTGSEWALASAGLVPNFRACFLQKHQDSKAHSDAVKVMLGIGADVPGAPALEEFESLFQKLKSGSSMRSASKRIRLDFGFFFQLLLTIWVLDLMKLKNVSASLHDVHLPGCGDFKGQSSDKDYLMAWCLSEIVTEQDREFLEKCVSISLTRDGRRQRLLCRFGGCTDAWAVYVFQRLACR